MIISTKGKNTMDPILNAVGWYPTLRMEGGLKSRELEESVPRRDLLGVSGLMRDWSPPEPNITLWREAGVLHLLAKAFLAPFLLGLEFSLSPPSGSYDLTLCGRLSVVPP